MKRYTPFDYVQLAFGLAGLGFLYISLISI